MLGLRLTTLALIVVLGGCWYSEQSMPSSAVDPVALGQAYRSSDNNETIDYTVQASNADQYHVSMTTISHFDNAPDKTSISEDIVSFDKLGDNDFLGQRRAVGGSGGYYIFRLSRRDNGELEIHRFECNDTAKAIAGVVADSATGYCKFSNYGTMRAAALKHPKNGTTLQRILKPCKVGSGGMRACTS